MKTKILLLLIIMVLALSSCDSWSPQYPEQTLEAVYPHYTLNTIMYDGHKYIVVYGGYSLADGVSITHSGSCKCKE